MCCFVKQKTAYEMRISDWSSDVCSSDLSASPRPAIAARPAPSHRGSARKDRRDQVDYVVWTFKEETVAAAYRAHLEMVMKLADRQVGNRLAKRRSEERRVGKGWVSTCRSRWSPNN